MCVCVCVTRGSYPHHTAVTLHAGVAIDATNALHTTASVTRIKFLRAAEIAVVVAILQNTVVTAVAVQTSVTNIKFLRTAERTIVADAPWPHAVVALALHKTAVVAAVAMQARAPNIKLLRAVIVAVAVHIVRVTRSILSRAAVAVTVIAL
jgi:hypothetical protein